MAKEDDGAGERGRKEGAGQDGRPEDGKSPPGRDGVQTKDRDQGKQAEGGQSPDGGQEYDDKKRSLKKPPTRWPLVAGGVVVAAFAFVVLWIVFVPRPDVWTDDAYVTVHYATIAPRVSGQVAAVAVNDNQVVRAGDVLVTLDSRDYQATVDMAQAALERDEAQVGNATANLSRQPSLIMQQEADVASAKARLAFSQLNQKRYSNLATTGAGSGQEQQQTTAQLQQDQAALQSAQAALDASRKQLDVLKQQRSASEGTVKGDRAQLEQARLNLSYTRILAPVDGMVGQRTVEAGNIVASGGQLMVIVPLGQVYVMANYREVALRHLRAGQRATIHVDAYDLDLDGLVDSVPPASGATFANIAPNNATGNFTKIVQRLPVKIVLAPNQPQARLLRVGFSVETTVHTELEDVPGEQERTPERRITAN